MRYNDVAFTVLSVYVGNVYSETVSYTQKKEMNYLFVSI